MDWLTITSFIISIVSMALASILWRRLATLERSARREPKNPLEPPSPSFHTTLLNYEAMFQELEQKSQEAIKRIERREQELVDALALADKEVNASAALSPSAAQNVRETPRTSPSGWTEKTEAILRLADEGLDAVAIAQRLGLGKGEVQLVLDIRKTAQ